MLLRFLLTATVTGACLIGDTLVAAFVPLPTGKHPRSTSVTMTERRSTSTRLYYYFMDPKDGGGSNNEKQSSNPIEMELKDLEQARTSFETLLNCTIRSSRMSEPGVIRDEISEHRERELETKRRVYRQETVLLQRLLESDAAIDELVHLWSNEERDDVHAAEFFRGMQEHCSRGLVQEERALKRMIEIHSDWAEPYSRLATLYYYRGQYDEAVMAAAQALQRKPWHVEALQMCVVMAKTSPGNFGSAERHAQCQKLAERYLPKLESPARKVWVEQALEEATTMMKQVQEKVSESSTVAAEFDGAQAAAVKEAQLAFFPIGIWQ